MYSKEEQLKKNGKAKNVSTFGKKKYRIKKKSVKNLVSKEDKEYLEWLHRRDGTVCFVCGKNNAFDGIEWHHVKIRSSNKKDHTRLIPLCGSLHHRNGDLSPHGNAKRWRETFSLEVQLEYAEKIYNEYLGEK